MVVTLCSSCSAPRPCHVSFAFVASSGLTTRPAGKSSFAGCSPMSTRRPAAAAPRPVRAASMSLVPKRIQNLVDYGCRALAVAAFTALLVVSSVDPANAARGGGRVGGSSFRAPAASSRSYAPSRVAPPSGAYGGYGGGYGYGGYSGTYFGPSIMYSPMLLPIGGSVGTGFGTLVLTGAAAAFVYQRFAQRAEEKEHEDSVNPDVSVVTLKVGLLSTARPLQLNLDMVGRSADTSTVKGLRYVLEESVLALLRNPDYWVYGSVDTKHARLTMAEDIFNRRCMEERLKISEETLTNVGGRRKESAPTNSQGDSSVAPPEYIVVTLVCAASEDLAPRLPKEINSAADIKNALSELGGVSVDSLQGIEVIWAPQALRDTLSEQEMLSDHPELRMI